MKNLIYIFALLFTLPFLCCCGEDPKPDEPIIVPKVVAFPGAEGAGQYASGGRGGKVIYVTNINDAGPGSLREAIEYLGSRTVVFSVSGTISLLTPLRIKNPNITIAGQTAPGDGICVKGCTTYVEAENVIIRFMRFRLGDVAGITQEDALGGENKRNVMIDHCTMSWSIDECASFLDNEKFTMQWCIISESLTNSVHGKGEHGYGGIWGGNSVTFHHNLLAHHTSRTPRMCGSRFSNQASLEKVDMRNNVFYNYGPINGGYGGEGGQFNIVNNYYKPGPVTATKSSLCNRIFSPTVETEKNYAQEPGIWGKFYVSGNYFDNTCSALSASQKTSIAAVNADNWTGIHQSPSSYSQTLLKLTSPVSISNLTTQTAQEAYTSVLAYAGASLVRDAVDTRIISEVTNGTYTYTGSNGSTLGIIDNQVDVGGWPTLNSTTAPDDTDVDGIPDTWEDANGLNKNSISDGKTKTLDPAGKLSNLEMYLNSLVAHLYPTY